MPWAACAHAHAGVELVAQITLLYYWESENQMDDMHTKRFTTVDAMSALMHENLKKYGAVFNTIAPGTQLSNRLVCKRIA